jgi:hypothetical protein
MNSYAIMGRIAHRSGLPRGRDLSLSDDFLPPETHAGRRKSELFWRLDRNLDDLPLGDFH